MAATSSPPRPDIHPYKVEQQPGGQWAVVSPNLGPLPEYTRATEGEAITAALYCRRVDNHEID
jgi:hypothetical protein